jgi:hypothetical protein
MIRDFDEKSCYSQPVADGCFGSSAAVWAYALTPNRAPSGRILGAVQQLDCRDETMIW